MTKERHPSMGRYDAGDLVEDYSKVPTPKATARPLAKPPKPAPHVQVPHDEYVAPPEVEHVTHSWPTAKGTAGTLVRYEGEVIGKVNEAGEAEIPSSGGIVSTPADHARALIQQGILTRVTDDGSLA